MQRIAYRIRQQNVIEAGNYTAAEPLHVFYVVPKNMYATIHRAGVVTSYIGSECVVEWVMLLPQVLPGVE